MGSLDEHYVCMMLIAGENGVVLRVGDDRVYEPVWTRLGCTGTSIDCWLGCGIVCVRCFEEVYVALGRELELMKIGKARHVA